MPTESATLLFVIRNQRVLLIRKKRGLGEGKINAPGGRLEPGETALACAVREVQEELCIAVRDAEYSGELNFQFTNGYGLHVTVFRAGNFDGEPTETDEAKPIWYDVDKIPFDEMWADDVMWMPALLAGKPFFGRFLFDDDIMLDSWLAKDAEIKHYLTQFAID
ncbi:MAG: 8-oxo-dGTP diphosphatase [Myxococcota bacterium]|nr:8-oxo-dGTP diphosphatase [Myxococcota bacterium]